jgi:DNA-binding transcriptional regulator YiaG
MSNGDTMFKNKTNDGKNNICGARIAQIRKAKEPRMSQRMLADLLQLGGLDVDKNAVQKMESGQRYITDIELRVIAKVLCVSYDDLLK